jgi:hypothetical protein
MESTVLALGSRFVLAVWSLAWGTHIASVARLIPVLARAKPDKHDPEPGQYDPSPNHDG